MQGVQRAVRMQTPRAQTAPQHSTGLGRERHQATTDRTRTSRLFGATGSSMLDPLASSASTASPSLAPSAASAGVRAMEATTVMMRIWFSSSGSSFNCGWWVGAWWR